jgi:hypothetical protein
VLAQTVVPSYGDQRQGRRRPDIVARVTWFPSILDDPRGGTRVSSSAG